MANLPQALSVFGLSRRASGIAAQLQGALSTALLVKGNQNDATYSIDGRCIHGMTHEVHQLPSGLHRSASAGQ